MHVSDLRDARRIAVLRALKIGDMLCAVPALRALRAAAPDAEITLIALPWAREFVARFPYVDEFVELPGWPGLPERPVDMLALPPFLRAMTAREFDIVLQLHGSGRDTNALAARLAGRRLACFADDDAWRPDDATVVEWTHGAPEVSQLLRLVTTLGAQPLGEHLEFPMSDGERAEASAFLKRRGLGVGAYAVVHPGASVPERRWPAERFAEVADGLAADGASIVVTGSGEEAAIGEAVAANMQAAAIVACGATPLGVLGALVERAAMVVCNDTAVSHIAAALRTRSVVISRDPQSRRWTPADTSLHCVLTDIPAGRVRAQDVVAAARELRAQQPATLCPQHSSDITPGLAGVSQW